MEPSPFYMVYRQGGGAPTFKHDSFEKAQAEAARIAQLAPGCDVYVLGALERVKWPLPVLEREAFSLRDDLIPF